MEAGTEPLWPQRGQADGHPAAFPDTLCPAPCGATPHSLQGSEHPPLLPLPPQSPFSALGNQQASPWSLSEPGAPAGSRCLCEGHPTRLSPAGSRPPGALSFTGASLCLTLMGAHVLRNGHGRRGGGGRGDSGGEGGGTAGWPRAPGAFTGLSGPHRLKVRGGWAECEVTATRGSHRKFLNWVMAPAELQTWAL